MDSEVSPPSRRHSVGGGELGDPWSPRLQARTGREKQWLPPNCLAGSVLPPACLVWSLDRSGASTAQVWVSRKGQPRTATAAGRQAGRATCSSLQGRAPHPPSDAPEPARAG